MKTTPIYLDDPYQQEVEAEILEVSQEEDGRYKLILDQTVFYPMGGGQPTDQGALTADGWEGRVNMVMMKNGEIAHYVKADASPEVGMKVKGELKWGRRMKNMRVHTAGHLVDFAMYILGYSPDKMVPTKGEHGKKAYIIYKGAPSDTLAEELTAKANELVSQDLAITWELTSFDDLKVKAIYLQPNLPTNKPLRMVTLEGIGSVADGGTLLKSTGEVGTIVIKGVDVDGEFTKVSYRIE